MQLGTILAPGPLPGLLPRPQGAAVRPERAVDAMRVMRGRVAGMHMGGRRAPWGYELP